MSQFRSPQSFGVSGVLSEDCKVYYENFFGTHHIGRSSDLICARLSHLGLDELKVRALLLLNLFEAQRATLRVKTVDLQKEPLTIECGVDSEKIAIGISFRIHESRVFDDVEAFKDRIIRGTPKSEFEKILIQIYHQSEFTLLRVKPGVQIEVVSLLFFQMKDQEQTSFEVLVFEDPSQVEKTPKAAEYIELGDLNYDELLQVRGSQGSRKKSPGESLAKESKELEEALQAPREKVGLDEDLIVKGGSSDLMDQSIQVLQAGKKESQSIHWTLPSDEDDVAEPDKKIIKKIFKKVWPFKKTKNNSENSHENEISLNSTPVEGPQKDNLNEDFLDFAHQVEKGNFHKILENLKKQIEHFKPEKNPDLAKAKRWMDELLVELMAEKGRLSNIAHKLNESIRQIQFRSQQVESGLRETLRHKEDELQQKTFALERAKEQLQKATIGLRNYKSAKTESPEEVQYRQKYELTQKLLLSAREENAKSGSKVEDLRSQLSASSVSGKGKSGLKGSDVEALIHKFELTSKQVEELKNTNEQLTEMNKQLSTRLQELANEKESPQQNAGGDAQRLEIAMRQILNNQKEMEKMRLRVDEAKREELRVKNELQLTQMELKSVKAKVGQATAGGSSRKVA